MLALQDLNHRQISQVIAGAAERGVPLTLTVRTHRQWAKLHSRLLAARNHCLLLDMPMTDQGLLHEFAPGEQVGVSLKLKHHKYLFLCSVADQQTLQEPEGLEGPVLVLSRPARMQRLQRRAYVRAAVPEGTVVRGAFWLGGRGAEPVGGGPDLPVWQGRVTNLSAGGFSLTAHDDSARLAECGDVVGVRLRFGVGREAVYADAAVRHVSVQDGQAVLGFQFLGLEHSEEGRQALQLISRKVAQYQAQAPREEERPAPPSGFRAAGQPAPAAASSEDRYPPPGGRMGSFRHFAR